MRIQAALAGGWCDCFDICGFLDRVLLMAVAPDQVEGVQLR